MKQLTKRVQRILPEEKKAVAKNLKLAVGSKPSGYTERLAERVKRINRYFEVAEGAWFEIGKELAEIQAEGDFPDKTFEAFIRREFQRSRDWGYKMIEGYKVKAGLPEFVEPVIQNQKQALALKAAPKEDRVEVLQEASKDGSATPKKISEAVETVAAKKSKPEKPKDAEFEELDALGKVIPQKILPLWNRAKEFAKEARQKISEIRVALKKEDMIFAEVKTLHEDAGALHNSLNDIAPYCLCPKCDGKGCAVCGKRGFISKSLYKMSGHYGEK